MRLKDETKRNILVSTSKGKMTKAIMEYVNSCRHKFNIVGILADGENIGDYKCYKDIKSFYKKCDWIDLDDVLSVVDFSSPKRTMEIIEQIKECDGKKLSLIIGTTGFSEEENCEIQDFIKSKKCIVIKSPNFAIEVMKLFKDIGTSIDYTKAEVVTITEYHAEGKKDLPSGTAIEIVDLVKFLHSREKKDLKAVNLTVETVSICFSNQVEIKYVISVSPSGLYKEVVISNRTTFVSGALLVNELAASRYEKLGKITSLSNLGEVSNFLFEEMQSVLI